MPAESSAALGPTDSRYRALLDASSALADQPTVKAVLRSLRDVLSSVCKIHGAHLWVVSGARFTHDGRHMSFAAGGQPPAMLVSDGAVRLLESRTGILGCIAETATPALGEEVELAPGDRLVLYTDGLTEVFNRSEEMLGIQGLEELVRQSSRLALPEMKQAILDGATAWSDGPLADDVSLVIAEAR